MHLFYDVKNVKLWASCWGRKIMPFQSWFYTEPGLWQSCMHGPMEKILWRDFLTQLHVGLSFMHADEHMRMEPHDHHHCDDLVLHLSMLACGFHSCFTQQSLGCHIIIHHMMTSHFGVSTCPTGAPKHCPQGDHFISYNGHLANLKFVQSCCVLDLTQHSCMAQHELCAGFHLWWSHVYVHGTHPPTPILVV